MVNNHSHVELTKSKNENHQKMMSRRRRLISKLFFWSFWLILSNASEWTLLYEEDFTVPLSNEDTSSWELETYETPFDSILDDSGTWYENDYGQAFNDALSSFHTYRKEFRISKDGWLTASLSARDWDKDGVIEDKPIFKIETLNGRQVLTMDVNDHTGGAILRPTNPLPDEYRIEYKLFMLDFGGKRDGSIEYDGRINGYSKDGCKTQHPWGEGSKSSGWSGDASEPYCNWQSVREGRYGYNGFHFLAIADFPPAPRNNHFWHYRRKVLMDSFSQHPDRVGDGSGGKVCNAETGEYYDYRNSSFNTVNMWISGLPGTWQPNPGGLTGSSQRFITSCNGGVATRGIQSATELQPELLLPNEYYSFAIERNSTGYTLEASGNFSRVGEKTLRFFRPFVVEGEPIWHYNTKSSEYDGQFNNDLKQLNWAFGSTIFEDQWPAGSAYPDYFVIGDLYTNVYEGKASLTDIRLFEPAVKSQCSPTVLMKRDDKIENGQTLKYDIISITQQTNGNLEVRKDPDDLVWESGVDGSTDYTYYTTIQGDSNIITWRLGTNNARSVAWKSNTMNPDGFYYFVLECTERGGGVAIYLGHPEEGGEPVWKLDESTATISPSKATGAPIVSSTSTWEKTLTPTIAPTVSSRSEAPSLLTIDRDGNVQKGQKASYAGKLPSASFLGVLTTLFVLFSSFL